MLNIIGLGWSESNSELVVVDDGSNDGTRELVELMKNQYPWIKLIKPEARLGLAASIRAGIEASNGDYCLIMDTDGMHDPAYAALFLKEAKKGGQLIIGSRYVSGGTMLGGLYPKLSRMMNYLIQRITKSEVKDQLCGFFLASRTDLSSVPNQAFCGFGEYFIHVINFFEKKSSHILEIPTIHRIRLAGSRKSIRRKMVIQYLSTALMLRNDRD